MKKTLTHLLKTILVVVLLPAIAVAKNTIDPIKFSLSTTATQVKLGEEFELEIKATYMYVPANTAFVFEGSNAFRLKLILPDGFEQTGGDFTDFVGGELSSTKPYLHYTLKGKFTRNSGDGIFRLLRSHKNADNQSTFIEVGKLPFNTDEGQQPIADENTMRIAATTATGFIPYLTISQLRAGEASDENAVFVTDEGKYGLFRYNSSSSAADDGAMTIVAGSRRYERVYEGTVNVQWFGVVADGTTDQSATIQAMLNNANYRNVFFPKGSASYRIKSIRVPSNSTLTFEEGTVVEGMGTLGTSEKMIYMYDVYNIIIRGYGTTFKDKRENYTSGQWRHIFSMEGVANVTLEGMAANNSGGDGFYVGAGSVRKVSENVRLVNVSADNNRRHGIAVTTVKNIEIINPVMTNTNGEGPQAGINFEANNSGDSMEGIRVTNPKTGGNNGPGMIICPGKIADTGKSIDIVVSNHVDDGSQYGFLVQYVTGVLPGSVSIDNPTWKNSRLCGFVARNWGYRGCAVVVNNPTVINANTSASTSPSAGAAFYVHREKTDTGDTYIGNIHLMNPKIMDTRSPMLTRSSFSFKDWNTNDKIVACTVMDPIKVANFFPSNVMFNTVDLTLFDRYQCFVHELGGSNSIADFTYYKTWYYNQYSTSGKNLTLGKVNPGFPEVNVEVRAPYAITVIPNATDNIMPLAPTAGKYITSKVVGSRLKLRKILPDTWFIVEMSGTWTVQP